MTTEEISIEAIKIDKSFLHRAEAGMKKAIGRPRSNLTAEQRREQSRETTRLWRERKKAEKQAAEWTPKGGTLEDRINAIVQRAQATADAMMPGRDAFYRGGLSIKGSRL